MKGFLTILAMIASAGLGVWVYRDSARRMTVPVDSRPTRMPAVEAIHLARSTIEDGVELVGGLEARSDVELRPQISGYLVRLMADSGDFVAKGQLLAELDDSKLQESVTHAEADLRLANSQLQARKMQFESADNNYRRQIDLARRGVGTIQQREEAETQMKVCKAEVELEQARVNEVEADLLRTKLALGDTRIVAPMSGYVAERQVDVGELSKPDVVLMRIVDISTVKTVVHIVERDYPKVEPGQDARISVDAFPGQRFTGKVVRKAPILDPLTRTAAVFIEIANAEKLLKPGMHARVRLVFGRHKEARVLPVAALIDQGEKTAVYVLTGNPVRAMLRRVRTGYSDGDVVEILSGLTPRDQIAVSGVPFLKEGEAVAAIDRDAATLAASEMAVAKPIASKRRN